MKEEILARLVDETFSKIACPLQGNGVYAEIKKAIEDAYVMGKNQADSAIEKIYAPVMIARS